MKFWNMPSRLDGIDEVGQAAEITDEILGFLPIDDSCPRLVRIGHGTEHPEPCRYLIEIEIAPGVILPTEFGTLEGLEEELESEDDDLDGAVESVRDALGATMPMVQRLADAVHGARLQARRIVGGWNADGLPTRLIDVQLAPHDHWRGSDEPALHVIVEELGDNLQPAAMTIQVEVVAKLATEMAECRDQIARGYAARARFARLGASGSVSRLALNAIGHFGDVDETLRRFGDEWRFWLPDDTAIMMSNGFVGAGSGNPDAKFDWWDGHVNVRSLFTPLPELLEFVGQPVSALLDHEFLSDDLIITGASTSLHEGRPTVTIEFTNPELLFCSTTGRVWDAGETDVQAVPATETLATNVVQFRARASV